MNEIDKLIWPNTSGIGVVPTSAVNYTWTIAKKYIVIKKTPPADSTASSDEQASIRSLRRHTVRGGRQIPTQGITPVGVRVIPPRAALSRAGRTAPTDTKEPEQ